MTEHGPGPFQYSGHGFYGGRYRQGSGFYPSRVQQVGDQSAHMIRLIIDEPVIFADFRRVRR